MRLTPFPARPFDDRLRDYQRDAICSVHAHLVDGRRSVLVCAATGLGKTITFVSLARALGARTLIIAHREELIAQAVRSVEQWWPGVTVGIVKGPRNEHYADVVVGSIQSLVKKRRLAHFTPASFDLVIIDECHHADAQSFRQVLEHLRAGTPEGPALVGVTATPDRADGRGLGAIFEAVAVNYDISWALEHGHLCDIRAKAVDIGLDLSGVKTRHGDFAENEVADRMLKAAAPERIVTEWLAHGENRKTMVFTPTVEVARLTAEEFTRAGISAAYAHGGTDPAERASILARYKADDIKVLVNCALFVEGFDEPSISCIVMARPTKSRPLYVQCAGRALRNHPGKTDALILDLVGASHVHSLVTAKDLLGVHELIEGDTATKALKRKAEEEEREAEATQQQLVEDWEYGTRAMTEVDPVGRPRGRKYAWAHRPVSGCQARWVAFARGHNVTVRSNTHRSGRHVGHRDHPWIAAYSVAEPGKPEVWGDIIATGKLSAVLDKAERWLDGNGGIRPHTDWRKDPATRKQIGFLRSRDIDATGWTKAQAGREISRLKAADVRAADVTDAWAMQQVRDTTPERVAEWVNAGGTIATLAKGLVPDRLSKDAATMLHRQLGVACDRGLVDRTRALEVA